MFEITRFWFPVAPTPTVPNRTELLLTLICGAGGTAVAERFTTAGVAPSLPWTVSVPVNVPVADGVTATVKFPSWPVVMDIGRVTPVRLNCGLEILAWVIETGMVPLFKIATDWVVCFPIFTLPKFTTVGLTTKLAELGGVLLPLTIPAQPPRIPVHKSAVNNAIASNFCRGLAGRCRAPIPLASAVPLVPIVFPSASFISQREYRYYLLTPTGVRNKFGTADYTVPEAIFDLPQRS